MQCGVDVNVTDRLLLLSSKPSLHTNVDCTALVAAVVSRQVTVVGMLLKVIFQSLLSVGVLKRISMIGGRGKYIGILFLLSLLRFRKLLLDETILKSQMENSAYS